MSFFNTNIDSILSSCHLQPSLELSQVDLQTYVDRITADGSWCNDYYLKTQQDENNSQHENIYKIYADTLDNIFTKVIHCDASIQLSLVKVLYQTLVSQDKNHFGECFMKNHDITLQKLLSDLLITNHKPVSASVEMKRLVLELLERILCVCRPLESLAWVNEKLYDLDWTSSSDDNDQNDLSNMVMIFVTTIQVYGKSVLENSLGDIKIYNYITPLLTSCVDALSFVNTMMRQSIPANLEHQMDYVTIINSILDLVTYCYSISSDTQQQDRDAIFHIANYLVVLIFDKFVSNVNTTLSSTYYEQHHRRYKVKKKTTSESPNKSDHNVIMDCVSRCLTLVAHNGLTFDRLLLLQRQYDDGMILGKSELRFPLSYNGIMTMMALSIYDRYMNTDLANQDPRRYLFPLLIDPVWIGRNCLGMIISLLHNPQDAGRIDKSLLILLYLADNVDSETLSLSLDILDKELQGPLINGQKMTLVKAFQTLTSMTCMADNANFRFLGHQLLQRFLQLGTDEIRLFVLTELLQNCPFPTMHTAAIGLLKDQVDQALRLKHGNTMFCSRVILDKFFPIIYQVDNNKDNDNDTDKEKEIFWDKYNYHMQALNFYYYLMMADEKENYTCVWDQQQIEWLKTNYLNPLEQKVIQLYSLCQQDDDNDSLVKCMQLDMMKDIMEKITNKTQSKQISSS
ncbi:uncharacterized protein BX664DRAFT_388292 [Halteromyces radiatus]|uniref:uncharacterized protein n=1 Tax=Halteromyces radiatus TaxID=101107 RepID=UPI00221F1C33|nr:uncharacterized protein BX664DRAFT_388292 [Halteromyces radiatus]KAI8081281.1 hypothetical protein BX664DRAFT_388292 [Halteromyces radiatus]